MLTSYPSVTPSMWQLPVVNPPVISETVNTSEDGTGDLTAINSSIVNLNSEFAGLNIVNGFQRVDSGTVDLSFPGNTPTELTFTPTAVVDTQTGWALGHSWWNGSLVTPFPYGSTFGMKIILICTTDISGGSLQAITANTYTQPFMNVDTSTFPGGSGYSVNITLNFAMNVMPNYANGGYIWLVPSVPLTVTRALLAFLPWSL